MTFEKEPVKIYRMTMKKLIANLSGIKECDLNDFKDQIVEAFEGYDCEDVEDVTGFEKWPDISNDGEYELPVKLNHERAYELTLHVSIRSNKATINNVL